MRFFLAFTVLFLAFNAFAQKQNSLKLSGTVSNIEIKDTDKLSDEVRLKLDLKMSALNQSSANVIVLTGYKSCDNLSVSTLKGENFGSFIIPTSSFLPKAKEINGKLNKAIPPEKLTKTLLPNENWEFAYDFEYSIPRKIRRTEQMVKTENGEKLTFVTTDITDSPISLEEIKRNIQLKFTLQCSLEPRWIDENNKVAHDLFYFQKLSDKWKKFGNLWTRDLVSEPILVDFGSLK
ncbi:MAG TPA: hypothetical protein PKY59_04745 [Pyrinomonadaceae bacterium]|nr:hypothetical protein [Pyrinomonadaceae bacterium]